MAGQSKDAPETKEHKRPGAVARAYTAERYAESKQMALWVKNPTGQCPFSRRYSKNVKSSVISLIASLTVLCSTASDEVTVFSRHRLALLKQHRWSDEDHPGYGRLRLLVTGPEGLAEEIAKR